LPQLAESVRLATPLARFGKVVQTASKQRVGSSNLPGRASLLGSNPETRVTEYTRDLGHNVGIGSVIPLAFRPHWLIHKAISRELF
jgi:hypothetical protein